MKTFEYHPFARFLTLQFDCPVCGSHIDSDALEVPQADFGAEKARDSENFDDFEITCSNCDWSTEVSLFTRYDGGLGQIAELPADTDVDVKEELVEE